MDLTYHSTILTYERKLDRVTPVRVRKEWIADTRTRARRFVTVRTSVLRWSQLAPREQPVEPWWSVSVHVPTRAELLESGTVREVGHGLPCLTLYP